MIVTLACCCRQVYVKMKRKILIDIVFFKILEKSCKESIIKHSKMFIRELIKKFTIN